MVLLCDQDTGHIQKSLAVYVYACVYIFICIYVYKKLVLHQV